MRLLFLSMSCSCEQSLWQKLVENFPEHLIDFEYSKHEGPKVLRKSLIENEDFLSWYSSFEKRIWFTCDPRNQLINLLLLKNSQKSFSKTFLSLLERKEENPRSIPMKDLFNIGLSNQYAKAIKIHKEIGDYFFMVKQEDENYLSDYLNIPLALEKSLRWQSWFTEEDIDFFNPLIKDYVDYFGYGPWDFDASPTIEEASKIYRKLSVERLISNS